MPEIRGLNPAISKLLYRTFVSVNCIENTKIKKKRPGMATTLRRTFWAMWWCRRWWWTLGSANSSLAAKLLKFSQSNAAQVLHLYYLFKFYNQCLWLKKKYIYAAWWCKKNLTHFNVAKCRRFLVVWPSWAKLSSFWGDIERKSSSSITPSSLKEN